MFKGTFYKLLYTILPKYFFT